MADDDYAHRNADGSITVELVHTELEPGVLADGTAPITYQPDDPEWAIWDRWLSAGGA